MEIQTLKEVNKLTLKRLMDAVMEVNTLIEDPEIDLDDEARLLSRRGNLFAEITTQSIIQAHLKASQIVVEFSAPQVKELEKFEDKLEGFIIAGLKVNALLNLVPKLIEATNKIGTRITSHTAMA